MGWFRKGSGFVAERECSMNVEYKPKLHRVDIHVSGSYRVDDGKYHLDNSNVPDFMRQAGRFFKPYTNVFIHVNSNCSVDSSAFLAAIMDLRMKQDAKVRPNIILDRENKDVANLYEMTSAGSEEFRRRPDFRLE